MAHFRHYDTLKPVIPVFRIIVFFKGCLVRKGKEGCLLYILLSNNNNKEASRGEEDGESFNSRR